MAHTSLDKSASCVSTPEKCAQLFYCTIHPPGKTNLDHILTIFSRLSLHSDIDLAAWGIPERDYLRAVGQLQALDAAFAIDLLRLEEVPATLRSTIEQEGQVL